MIIETIHQLWMSSVLVAVIPTAPDVQRDVDLVRDYSYMRSYLKCVSSKDESLICLFHFI